MENGLYVATSGLLMQQNRVDVIANNLANINTNGFKKDTPVFSLYRPTETRQPQNLIRQTLYNKTINSAVKLDDIKSYQGKGQFKPTGNTFDFALGKENAFFVIDTPYGLRYTRDGEFTLNSDGKLVTQDGYPIVSKADRGTGNIIIDDKTDVRIDKKGKVYADGKQNGAILLMEFDSPDHLQKVGRNLWAAVDTMPKESENADLKQGYVEGSNVDPVTEMVRMIEASRGYEMYAKVVQTHDEMNHEAATKIIGQA